MLKVNRRVFYWFLQLFGWGSYGMLVFFASIIKDGFNSSSSFFINLSISIFLGMFLSHILRNRILLMGLLRINRFKDLLKVILIVSIISIIYVVSTKVFTLLLSWSTINFGLISFMVNWASFFLLFGFWLTLYYGYHLFEETQRQELDNLVLKASQTELELQNLRSQLNPHFLFNALNSIRALVEVNPKKSKEAVTLLSNLLRFSLSTSYDRLISIENELQMVDAYLSLEKIRFEERIRIVKEINEEVKSFRIPAFTIQTLVENAIKHGVSKLIEGGEIFIRVTKIDELILIQVSNSGELGTQKDLGIGLDNLCKRLDIEYKTNYKFSIYQADLVHVEIQIPANR